MGEQPKTVMGPREVFARMRQQWLSNTETDEHIRDFHSLLADDAVIETPFAPPGRPRRFRGREEFLAFARAGRAALPVRFEECRDLAIHDTADPEVIVVEYELAGTVTTTGRRAAVPFIGVLRVRDGQVTGWREYQDAVAIARALGQLPALLASAGTAWCGSPTSAPRPPAGRRSAPGASGCRACGTTSCRPRTRASASTSNRPGVR